MENRIKDSSSSHNINGIMNNMTAENQPYRTCYHFQPQQNWMNDPNGPMHYKGIYHFFYQHNPYAPKFGAKMVWGHSVSYDLINWIHLNHALEPSEPYDIHGCFSGSATILTSEEKPFILYTGFDENRNQVQNLAMPKNPLDPFLKEWIKFPQNPILHPPSEVDVKNFRDPTTAWKGSDGKWRVIVGARNGDEGKAILYHSEDFVNWESNQKPFYVIENVGMCECPDFFPVLINGKNGVDTSSLQDGDSRVRHVLKISYQEKQQEYYFIGDYLSNGDNFVSENNITGTYLDLKMDHGEFYASKSFFDYAKKRRIFWGWVKELDTPEGEESKKGWAGLQSIPRQVWLDNSGKWLMQWPIEEVKSLRGNHVSIMGKELVSGSNLEVLGITASQADIEVVFELPELENAEFIDPIKVDPESLSTEKYSSSSRSGIIGPFGLLALASEDLKEHIAIFFRIYKTPYGYACLMCTDLTRSTLKEDIDRKPTYATIFDIDTTLKTISLRSLIDRSIIESFGEEGKVCFTNRVYPLLAKDKDAHLFVFNNGSKSVVISQLNAWSMKQAEFIHQENKQAIAKKDLGS